MVKVRKAVDKALEWVLVVLMGFSVLNVLWQVFTRFVLRNPSSVTEELARYMLIWIGILAAGYGVGKRAHLAIDLLPLKLKGDRWRALELVIQLVVAVFALFVMVIGGIRLVSIVLYLDQTSAAMQVKLGYVYLVLPITGLLILFYTVLNIIEIFRPSLVDRDASPDGRTPAAVD